MWMTLLEAAAWTAAFYTLIPSVLVRLFGFRALRRAESAHRVALTFDDGPDPIYTPRLLDLLRRHGVRATFFVVGERADRYPDLVRRIREEGHLVGLHNYRHRTNWLMGPFGVRRGQLARAADAVERCTGERPRYYRPPWELVNLFDLALPRAYRIVLWSVMGWDWWLADALPALAARPSFAKRAAVAAWLAWERVVGTALRFRPVGPGDPLLKFRLTRYRGREPLALDAGARLVPGDPVIELHLDNARLYRLALEAASPVQLAVMLLRETERLLPWLAWLIAHDPDCRRAKALYGISLVNRGPGRLGFRVHDLPDGAFARLTQAYLRPLLAVIHPSGLARLKKKTEMLVPKQMTMSLAELFRRYGDGLIEDFAYAGADAGGLPNGSTGRPLPKACRSQADRENP